MPKCGIARGITDRAKRYRANRCKKLGKSCEQCGSRENLGIGHRDGNESNNKPHNLGTLCKKCNGKQAADKKAGRGVRTRQYNPGAINLAQYVQAAMDHVRGSHDAGGRILHETPKAIRRQFAKEIWWRRGYRGNPPADIMPEFWAGKLRDSHGRVVKSEAQAKAILLSELRALGEIPARRNGKEGNPDTPADKLFRKFHGVGPDNHLTFKVPELDPYGSNPELAQFGLLVRLVIGEGVEVTPGRNGDPDKIVATEDYFWSSELNFVPSVAEYHRMERAVRNQDDVNRLKSFMRRNGTPDVAGVPESPQIYIVGGNQSLDDAKLREIGADPEKELIDCGFCYLIEYYTQKGFDKMQPTDYFHKFGEKTGVAPRLIYWRKAKLLQLVGGEYFVTWRGIHN